MAILLDKSSPCKLQRTSDLSPVVIRLLDIIITAAPLLHSNAKLNSLVDVCLH